MSSSYWLKLTSPVTSHLFVLHDEALAAHAQAAVAAQPGLDFDLAYANALDVALHLARVACEWPSNWPDLQGEGYAQILLSTPVHESVVATASAVYWADAMPALDAVT